MMHKVIFITTLLTGLILMSTFSATYAQVALQSSSIKSGGTNSTSSGFSLISSIGEIAGFMSSSSFQIIAGFLPLTQGGNTIPTGMFSGVTPTIGSDGSFTIPSGSSSLSMDFSKYSTFTTSGSTPTITLQQDFSFSDAGTLGGSVFAPAGTIITADVGSWTGSFLTPQAVTASTIAAPGGGTTSQVIRMGLTNIDFTFSQPVRFTFTGKAGESAASVDKNGVITEITTTCNGVDFTTVNAQLSAGQACKINNNNDLLVWTRTLSDKITFSSAVATSGGGSSKIDGTAPSFTQAFKESEYPLVIGNTIYPKLGFHNEKTATAKLETQTQIPIKLLMYENIGTHNVQHVALYMNLHSLTTEVHKSDTWLVYEKNRLLEISDPHGFIADASAATSVKGDKFEVVFNIIFAKPMEKSNLVIVAWDYNRNAGTTTVLDAFEVTESKKTTEVGTKMFEEPAQSQPEVEMTPEPGIDVMFEDQKETIQKWAGYHTESAADSELLDALNIKLDNKDSVLPNWIKSNLAKWILDEKISFKEFRKAIEYVAKL